MGTECVGRASESRGHVHDHGAFLEKCLKRLDNQDLADHIDLEHILKLVCIEGRCVVVAMVDPFEDESKFGWLVHGVSDRRFPSLTGVIQNEVNSIGELLHFLPARFNALFVRDVQLQDMELSGPGQIH